MRRITIKAFDALAAHGATAPMRRIKQGVYRGRARAITGLRGKRTSSTAIRPLFKFTLLRSRTSLTTAALATDRIRPDRRS
jgi:hypothetical protein